MKENHEEYKKDVKEFRSSYSRPGSEVDLEEFEEAASAVKLDPEPKKKTSKESGKKDKKNKKGLLIALLVAGAVLLLVLIAAVGTFLYFYNRSSYDKDESSYSLDPSEIASVETIDPSGLFPGGVFPFDPAAPSQTDEAGSVLPSYEGPTLAPSPDGETKPVQEIIQPAQPVPVKSEVYNLLLIGVDREGQKGTNSDTMILVSINKNKKTLTLTSVMRDSAANIPGVGFTKINSAFAVGGSNVGAQLLCDTLRNNFGFPINNYAWVNFGNMKTIMDMIGGVDIQLTVKEAKRLGITIDSPQVVHLTGAQALSYSRDRSSGGSDYGRTQRQRNVIQAVLQKARSGGLGDLVSLANAILPYIHHNIDAGTFASLLMNVGEYVKYGVQELRIPINGSYYSYRENLIMDFQVNSNAWRNLVY